MNVKEAMLAIGGKYARAVHYFIWAIWILTLIRICGEIIMEVI